MMKYILLFLLLPAIGNGQVVNMKDTARATGILIAGDSTRWYDLQTWTGLDSAVVWPARPRDTVAVILLVTDTLTNVIRTIKGYSVREQHNTAEGQMDAGFNMSIDENGNLKSPYSDYWLHLYFIGSNRKQIPKNYIVWLSKDL